MKCLKGIWENLLWLFFFFYGKLCLGLFKNIEFKIVTLIMRQKIN